MASNADTMDAETKASLHRDLVRLGDMMGDGLHLEPDGKWIAVAYRKTMRALGHSLPRRNNRESIDKRMAEALGKSPCPACGGALKQVRAGSLRAMCDACQGKYQFGTGKRRATA